MMKTSLLLPVFAAASFLPAQAENFVRPADVKSLPKSVSTMPGKIARPTAFKKVLPNGLTVLVLENHGAPVVAVRAYVRTGSIYEAQHLGSGISHLFEHVLAEGTKKRSKKQMDEEVEAIGGQSNAYTSYDVTAYHITTAVQYYEKAVDLLADQLQNATFPEKEVLVQQGVIHNEMNMNRDDPQSEIYNLFYETAFKVHPVRYPVIGYREQFDKLTPQDIVSYYKSHYTPDNTVLSIAGDVDANSVVKQARELFKDWPRGVPQQPALPTEPRQIARRRAVVEKEIGQSHLMMGWHSVPLQNPNLYALDVLAQVLGGGNSSRLVRELREKQNLVSSVAAWSSTPNYNAGMLAVRAEFLPKNQDKVGTAIWKETTKLWSELVTPEELSAAKRQIEANFVFSNQDVEEQAEQIAYDELSTGDPGFSAAYVERIRAVTAEQVRAAAKQFITRDGMTTVLVVPKGKGDSAAAAAPVAAVAPPEKSVLPNGLRLIIRENHASPTVAIVVQGKGGVRMEPSYKPGLSNLFAEMLSRSTTTHSYEEISASVDALGANFNSFGGYNAWGIDSQWMKRDWKTGLQLVADAVTQPAFASEDLARVKQQVLAGIQQQHDDPESEASLLMRSTFFGDHAYGRSQLGTRETIEKIQAADLKKFWEDIVAPRNMVLTIYGDVNEVEAKEAVAQLFGTFTQPGLPLPRPSLPATLTQFTEKVLAKPGLEQAVLTYGFPGLTVKDNDRYAVDVLDAALSGSNLPGGRLHSRLRDNQLVYYVHAYSSPGIDPGSFVIYAGTVKAQVAEVRKIIGEEVQKIRDNDITAQELERAKSMAISADAIGAQSNSAQAKEAAADELFGLGYRNSAEYAARINVVTVADVRRMAQKLLRMENAAFAVVQSE